MMPSTATSGYAYIIDGVTIQKPLSALCSATDAMAIAAVMTALYGFACGVQDMMPAGATRITPPGGTLAEYGVVVQTLGTTPINCEYLISHQTPPNADGSPSGKWTILFGQPVWASNPSQSTDPVPLPPGQTGVEVIPGIGGGAQPLPAPNAALFARLDRYLRNQGYN